MSVVDGPPVVADDPCDHDGPSGPSGDSAMFATLHGSKVADGGWLGDEAEPSLECGGLEVASAAEGFGSVEVVVTAIDFVASQDGGDVVDL